MIAEYLSADTIKNWGHSKKIAELCLGFRSPNHIQPEDDYIVRAILGGRDETSGAITIPTEVCEGTSIQYMDDQKRSGQNDCQLRPCSRRYPSAAWFQTRQADFTF